jgi:hypothetical protein
MRGGPRSDNTGLSGSPTPARTRLMESASASDAAGWPMTILSMSSRKRDRSGFRLAGSSRRRDPCSSSSPVEAWAGYVGGCGIHGNSDPCVPGDCKAPAHFWGPDESLRGSTGKPRGTDGVGRRSGAPEAGSNEEFWGDPGTASQNAPSYRKVWRCRTDRIRGRRGKFRTAGREVGSGRGGQACRVDAERRTACMAAGSGAATSWSTKLG